MPVDLDFAAAFIDNSETEEWSSHVVLGKRLRKFCLWHRLLLRTIDSPLIRGGSVSLFDIRTAVGICELRFGDSQVVRPKLMPCLLMLKAIAVSIFKGVFRVKRAPDAPNPLQASLLAATESFMAYCGDYLQTPEYAVVARPAPPGAVSRGKRGSMPEELQLMAEIVEWSKWSERYVWEMPLGRINYYIMVARKLRGMDIDPVDEEERKFQESVPDEFRRKE